MKTLVEDNELFIFEDACQPILSVLCGKVLEAARMEVLEEEELKEMSSMQKSFLEMARLERKEHAEMDANEAALLELH